MFDFIEKSVSNALDVVGCVINGEDVKREQVAKLIADGLTVAAVASATGLAVDVVNKMLSD